MSGKDYFTSREAADLLDVAVSTIQLWTNNGLLRAWTTPGGHRRIDRNSVEEMLSKQRIVSGDQSDKPLSVVVVEDDPQQCRLYEKQLLAWDENIQLVTASDGYQGLIKIGNILPDIIITDLIMPNIDGFQMIKALKEQPELAKCTLIVVSALTDKEIRSKGGLPPGAHVFTKPIPFERLERLLHKKERPNIVDNIERQSN